MKGEGGTMYKISIVEDDASIREELMVLLQNKGYRVEVILVFEEVAKQILERKPDLLLLDINLPGQDGFSICSQIRKVSKLPILFVTSRNNSMDELKGLLLGADDYIEKPYTIPILLARIETILARCYPKDRKETLLEYKDIQLDTLNTTVCYQNKRIELTRNEFKILYYLFEHKERIVPRMDIVEYMWDNQLFIDDNTLSVNITRIREKLQQIGIDNLIETKRGQGYRI